MNQSSPSLKNRIKVRIVIYIAVLTSLFVFSSAQAQSLEESFRAALGGDLGIVKSLIERGNSVDSSDADGSTLLMLASREGHTRVVEYLIGQKAAVNRRNKFGDTALMAACIKGKLEVAKLLLEHGAELNPEGWTPLHYAAFEGRTEVLKYLIDKGANKNAVAPNGFTALMLAVRGRHAETARAMLYADPDVNLRTESGETALKLAKEKGDAGLVDLLKRAGAVELDPK